MTIPAFDPEARNCLLCRFIDIDLGEPFSPGYSEVTPGSDERSGQVECTKDRFPVHDGNDIVGVCDLVRLCKTAETCSHFELSAEASACVRGESD